MSNKILGVNDGHGNRAALVNDTTTYHHIEGHVGFPFRSIQEVLKLANLTIGDIDKVAMATAFQGPLRFNSLPLLRARSPKLFALLDRMFNRERIKRVRSLGFRGKICFVAHHDAHAASAYYSSPGGRDNILVFTLDGAGDGLCATVNIGNGGKLRRISQTTSENSLGYIYGAVADLIGMSPFEVMTSAVPNSFSTLAFGAYTALKSYIGLDGLRFKKGFSGQIHDVKNLVRFDLREHKPLDIAAGLQRLTEELIIEWVYCAMEETGLGRIAAAGGVFLNTRANEHIRELLGAEGIFIPQSPGDESTSLGAAQYLFNKRWTKK